MEMEWVYIYILHEGLVVLEGDDGGGAVVVEAAVDGALAGGGHDDRRGERQRQRGQAEQEGHHLGTIWRRRRRGVFHVHHMHGSRNRT